MNKKKAFTAILCAAIVVGVFSGGIAFGASGSTPGSSSDPLVTKSYVDAKIKEISGTTAAGSEKPITEYASQSDGDSNTASSATKSVGFIKVTFNSGAKLYLSAGSEVVVYRGSCNVIGTNGLIDTSTGTLFESGNTAVKYHCFLSPDNSSGLEFTGKTTVFILGGYSTS